VIVGGVNFQAVVIAVISTRKPSELGSGERSVSDALIIVPCLLLFQVKVSIHAM
jgi:hypothetical protein